MSWTDERIGLLKKMWKEGKSAAEIAKTLGKGVTRNAVIGKAHRMGLSGRPSPIKKPAPAKKEAAPARKDTAVKEVKKATLPPGGSKPNPALAREAEELKKIEKEIVPLGGRVSLLALTERMCKWPIGDPREADFSFCGRNIRQGTPYCPEHASMAYQTSSRSRGPAVAIANDKVVAEEVPETPEAEEEEEVA